MLDNDSIMTAKASEVVQKVPTDEKDYYKCSLCVTVSIQPQHIQQKRLDVSKEHPAQLQEKAQDIFKFVRRKVQSLAHDEFYTKWKGDRNLQDFR